MRGVRVRERELGSLCGWCSLAAVCSHEALDIGRLTLSWLAEPSASTSPLGPHAPGQVRVWVWVNPNPDPNPNNKPSPLGPHAPQVMPSLSFPEKCLPG